MICFHPVKQPLMIGVNGFLITLIVLASFEIGEPVCAQDQPAKTNDSTYLAATVLGKKVNLRAITPAEVARNRETLSKENFARWQAESRWRPLVSRVSHLVMSDWAKNNVRPTPEEIQEHFASEARQHLQAYDTEEGRMQVALATGFTIMSAEEWTTAKALYEKHGGRVALSSFGAWVAIDGRNALLKEYPAAGKIQFHDPEIEKEFWLGVDNPSVLDVTVSDPKRIARRFATPPWEGWGVRTADRLKQNPNLFKLPSSEKKQPNQKKSADKSEQQNAEPDGN